MAIEKDVEIDLLSVDLANFRLGEYDDVRAAYQGMLDEQGEKLVNLATDILDHGLSPAERLIIVPDEDEQGHFIVCEGNRRLTAIRMMDDPRLAAGTPYYTKFAQLSKRFQKAPIRELPCTELPDKDTAFLWIERKHNPKDGRGLAQWGSQATGRAEAYRGRVRASKAVLDFLEEKGALTPKIERAIRRKTTNLDRVFQMPYMASTLGVKISKAGGVGFDNGDEKAGIKLLKSMVERMASDGFSVNDIRSKGQRWALIDEFADKGCLGEVSPNPVSSKAKVAKKAPRTKPPEPDQSARSTLALVGAGNVLRVKDKRLAELYKEARDINVATLTNSAAVLCRLFLELSTDYFLKIAKVPLPKTKPNQQPWRNWSERGLPLKTKIKAALHALDPTGKAKEFSEARKGISTEESIHFIDNLHEFVHNLHAVPDPKEVKKVWEKWHDFLHAMFAHVEAAGLAKTTKP